MACEHPPASAFAPPRGVHATAIARRVHWGGSDGLRMRNRENPCADGTGRGFAVGRDVADVPAFGASELIDFHIVRSEVVKGWRVMRD